LKHKRERYNKLLPKNHSPEVDYSLFMAVMMVLISERVEKHPGVTPVVFHPPIFTGTAYVSMFCVSPPPPLENTEGVFI
jgi:hypothetical protein